MTLYSLDIATLVIFDNILKRKHAIISIVFAIYFLHLYRAILYIPREQNAFFC